MLLLAAFVAHCQATITVFKPKTNDEWKYDDNKYVSQRSRARKHAARRDAATATAAPFCLRLLHRVLCGTLLYATLVAP